MQPKDIIFQWVEAFNQSNPQQIASFYADDATNHQSPNPPLQGKQAIQHFFESEFAIAHLQCNIINLIQHNQTVILEWQDPSGLRGCDWFEFQDSKIIAQRGYWDKLSFLRLNNLPIPKD